MTPIRPISPISPLTPPVPEAAPAAPTSTVGSPSKTSFVPNDPKQDGQSQDRDFVQSLGLLWRPDRQQGGQLQTVVDLQEAFASEDPWGLVYEVSRILGEAHADKLRTGLGLPPSVERQVMTEAYSRTFSYFETDLGDSIKNSDTYSFDDTFRAAACTAKDAFQSAGDAVTFRRRIRSLEVLRKELIKAGIQDLLELRQQPHLDEYLPALNKKLPLMLEHYKKMPASASKSRLKPDLDVLTNEALILNGMLAIYSNRLEYKLVREALEAKPPEDCRRASKKVPPPDHPVPVPSINKRVDPNFGF